MKCDIEGVVITELRKYDDDRGWLIELFRHDELEPEFFPAMGYVSLTRPGVTRGPHEHSDQADLFGFVGPSTFRLYLWDNRKDSPTFGHRTTVELGDKCPAAVLVPRGVVHAYKNIGEGDGLVFNAPNRLYAGEGKKGKIDEIRHESDPESPFRVG